MHRVANPNAALHRLDLGDIEHPSKRIWFGGNLAYEFLGMAL